MNFRQLSNAIALLRQGEELEKIGGTITEGAKALGRAGKSVFRGAAGLGAKAGDKGYKGVGTLIKYAPHAAIAAGGVAAVKSETGQKLRYKLRVAKAKRDMRKAQQTGYY